MRKHAHTRGVWGEIFVKLGVLRSLPRPYLYPNATSPTRVHGGVYYYTRQLSRAISVTIVDLVHVGPASYRWIDDLDKNSLKLVQWPVTAKAVTNVTTPNSLKVGEGDMLLVPPLSGSTAYVTRGLYLALQTSCIRQPAAQLTTIHRQSSGHL